MFDKQKAVDNAQKKLTRQQATLKQTLDEIEYVQKTAPTSVALINSLKTKRDRQATAVKATEELIAVYSDTKNKR